MPEFSLEVDDELAEEVRRLAAKLRITAEEFSSGAIRIYLADRANRSSSRPSDQ